LASSGAVLQAETSGGPSAISNSMQRNSPMEGMGLLLPTEAF